MAVSGQNMGELLNKAKWTEIEGAASLIKYYTVEFNNCLYQVNFAAENLRLVNVLDTQTWSYTQKAQEIHEYLKGMQAPHEYVTKCVKLSAAPSHSYLNPEKFDKRALAQQDVTLESHEASAAQVLEYSSGVNLAFDILNGNYEGDIPSEADIKQFLNANPAKVKGLIEFDFGDHPLEQLVKDIRSQSTARIARPPAHTPLVTIKNVGKFLEKAVCAEITDEGTKTYGLKRYKLTHEKLGEYSIFIDMNDTEFVNVAEFGLYDCNDTSRVIQAFFTGKGNPRKYLEKLAEKNKPLEDVLDDYVIIETAADADVDRTAHQPILRAKEPQCDRCNENLPTEINAKPDAIAFEHSTVAASGSDRFSRNPDSHLGRPLDSIAYYKPDELLTQELDRNMDKIIQALTSPEYDCVDATPESVRRVCTLNPDIMKMLFNDFKGVLMSLKPLLKHEIPASKSSEVSSTLVKSAPQPVDLTVTASNSYQANKIKEVITFIHSLGGEFTKMRQDYLVAILETENHLLNCFRPESQLLALAKEELKRCYDRHVSSLSKKISQVDTPQPERVPVLSSELSHLVQPAHNNKVNDAFNQSLNALAINYRTDDRLTELERALRGLMIKYDDVTDIHLQILRGLPIFSNNDFLAACIKPKDEKTKYEINWVDNVVKNRLKPLIDQDKQTNEEREQVKSQVIAEHSSRGLTAELWQAAIEKKIITNSKIRGCVTTGTKRSLRDLAETILTKLKPKDAISDGEEFESLQTDQHYESLLRDYETRNALYKELIHYGLINGIRDFNYYCQECEPRWLFSRHPLSFCQKLWCFQTLLRNQVKGSGSDTLNPSHFLTMIKCDFLTYRDYANLGGFNDQGFQIKEFIDVPQATIAIKENFGKIFNYPQFIGVGFYTWGDTCSFNSALSIMIRGLPFQRTMDIIKSKTASNETDPRWCFFADSFLDMFHESKRILDPQDLGYKPRILIDKQRKFCRSCQILAKYNKFNDLGNSFFGVKSIEDLKQHDAADIVECLMAQLGLKEDPMITFRQRSFYVTHTQYGLRFKCDKSERDEAKVISVNAYGIQLINRKPAELTMEDFYNEFCNHPRPLASRDVQWTASEIGCIGNGTYLLPTEKTYMPMVDINNWSKFKLVLGVTQMGDLRIRARAAFINSKESLNITVCDQNNCIYEVEFQLCTVLIHCCDNEFNPSSGHYCLATYHPSAGGYTIQDDRLDMRFEDYCQYMRKVHGRTEVNWDSFYDMIRVGRYTPVQLDYNLVNNIRRIQ